MSKGCNQCCNDHCHHKVKIPFCSEYVAPKVLKASMVEVAMVRELIQFGEIRNVNKALSKRRLGL